MTTGAPELIELLRDKIRAEGPMPFARFMERALYHPAHGYYSSAAARSDAEATTLRTSASARSLGG
jgi:SAM-dependent MidA family methyltransferase